MTDPHTSWFRPADDPQYWGTNPGPELGQLISIFHNALFREDETYGPEFRWSTSIRLFTDDDPLLGMAADQVAFAVLDHAEEIAALVATIRKQADT